MQALNTREHLPKCYFFKIVQCGSAPLKKKVSGKLSLLFCDFKAIAIEHLPKELGQVLTLAKKAGLFCLVF
jgi:hypothetical protein